jgi:hypothetical protein
MSVIKRLKNTIERVFPPIVVTFLKNQFGLVVIPYNKRSVISDLFPFKIKDTWDTHFELLNLPSLLNPENQLIPYWVRFIFFDENGRIIYEHKLKNVGCNRITINIKELVNKYSSSGYGTFACFHEYYGNEDQTFGGFIAERGYTGYQNKTLSNMKGYVHGNLDAIALGFENNLSCLGGYSRIKKYEFRLQHELTGASIYELGFVNSSNTEQRLIVFFTNQNLDSEKVVLEIPSRGIRWYRRQLNENEKGRINVVSRLNLARPVVFRHQEKSFDVFHG